MSLKTAKKFTFSIFIISSFVLTVGVTILFYNSAETEKQVYLDITEQLKDYTSSKLDTKYWIGRVTALSIADNSNLQTALKNNDRELAIKTLSFILEDIKKHTKYKDLKLHIHTKDNFSFVRGWKVNKYGDDLSSFRHSIVTVNKYLKPITTFEIGRVGLNLRAVTPIVTDRGEHLGSLEFIQEFNTVAKSFKGQGAFLLLMNIKKESDQIKRITSGKIFQNHYMISQSFVDETFLENASKINLNELFKNGYLIDENYFYTYIDIKDFKDDRLGVALVGKRIELVNYTVKASKELIYIALAIMIFMAISTMIFIEFVSKKVIINPLNSLKLGLDSFFTFAKKESDIIEKLDENLSAEFGEISKDVNKSIIVVSDIIKNDELYKKELIKINDKVKQLLNNADQGFLYFNDNMIIGGEHSKIAEEIFNCNIKNLNIVELLYPDDKEKQAYNQKSLKSILRKKGLRQELMLSLLQTEFEINNRFIQIDYKVLDKTSYMLILTDLTERKEFDQKIQDEQQVLKMVVETVISYKQFEDVKNDYESFCNTIERFKSIDNLPELRRNIHTFKGLFAQKEMLNIVKKLHEFETEIGKSIKDRQLTSKLLDISKDDMLVWLNLDLSILKHILGEEYFKDSNIVYIEQHRIDELYKKVISNTEIADEVKKLNYNNVKLFFKPYEKLIINLAKKLDKGIFPLEIESENIYVSNSYKPFFNSLVHIFRNSVDHGIELPDIREEVEKLRFGTIKCAIYKQDEMLHIDIEDDGAGMDIAKIRSLAIERGLVTLEKERNLSEQEIIMFIFKDEFSTATQITDISGRGVGLSSVITELEKLDGTINIDNSFGKGVKFNFAIPLNIGEKNG